MKQIIYTVAMAMYTMDLMAASRKIPEIICRAPQYSDSKWVASCNNGAEDLDITGVAVCSDVVGTRRFDSTDKLSTSDDEEDNINCWCRIAAPFKSNYAFHSDVVYANECNNWCSSFCARDIITTKAFRNELFKDIH